jgi:hypothetical protein
MMMMSPQPHSVVYCSIAVAKTYAVHFRIRHLSYLTAESTECSFINSLY